MNKPRWIVKLLAEKSCPYSLISQKDLSELKNLQLVRVNTAGTRRQVVITDVAQFTKWTTAKYPEIPAPPESIHTRAKNIIERRDSKSGKTTHELQPVLFKWFGPDDPDQGISWGELTQSAGFCALLSDRLSMLPLPDGWILLFVENWETFVSYSVHTKNKNILVIYLGGNVADMVLHSIAMVMPKPVKAVHFGDYDWTGLVIFQRIKSVIPFAELYMPDNLEALFEKFGKRSLVIKQKLPEGFNFSCPECAPVIRMIRQYNCGLEQEIAAHPRLCDG
jgi:hypothetical protein